MTKKPLKNELKNLAESVSATKHKVSKAEKAKKAEKKADTLLGKEKDTRKVSKRGRVGEGRPPKYSNAEQLQRAINDYFESCWVDKVTEVIDKEGTCTMSTVRYQNRPYTVAGMAYELGFVDRHSMYDYEKNNQEYSHIIKKARAKIEMYHEEELGNKNPAGHIFWLKNHSDYKDKQEIENYDMSSIQYTKDEKEMLKTLAIEQARKELRVLRGQ